MAEPKNVDIYITDAVKIDGVHHAVGEILQGVEPELAKELAGAGRCRLATAEDSAGAKKRGAKAE